MASHSLSHLEKEASHLIKDIADLDENFSNMTIGTITQKISDCNKKIKTNKVELAAAIERLTKLLNQTNNADNVLASVCNKIRSMSEDITVAAEEPKTANGGLRKGSNWADEMDEEDAKQRAANAVAAAAGPAENVWLKRTAARAANEIIFRSTPVANSVYNISAVHVPTMDEVINNKKYHGIICYVSHLEVFAFYTNFSGLVYGNGLVCNPPGNGKDARRCTIMCSLRKRCTRRECDYAHNPLDKDAPVEFKVLSSPHYNSRQNQNRNYRGEVISSIPFFDISDLDADLLNAKYDSLHRFGRVLMNFLIISAILTEKHTPLFMT